MNYGRSKGLRQVKAGYDIPFTPPNEITVGQKGYSKGITVGPKGIKVGRRLR